MNIHTLVLGVLETNVYILEKDEGLIVVDPADRADIIMDKASELNKSVKYVLITHGHFDHCNAAAALQKCGAKTIMSKIDRKMILDGFDLAKYCGTEFNDFIPDEYSEEGEIELLGEKVSVLSTPGHTAGSLTYVFGDKIFSGDVLFRMGVGRSDLPTGNDRQLLNSVKKLFKLNGTVYPGHGRPTTVEFEREHNIYVKTD